MEASEAAAALSGPSKRKSAAPATDPKKTQAKKPGPQSDDQVILLRFSEFCRYKADRGTTRVPRSKNDTDNVLVNWIHYIKNR
jgi:hypothetical protein